MAGAGWPVWNWKEGTRETGDSEAPRTSGELKGNKGSGRKKDGNKQSRETARKGPRRGRESNKNSSRLNSRRRTMTEARRRNSGEPLRSGRAGRMRGVGREGRTKPLVARLVACSQQIATGSRGWSRRRRCSTTSAREKFHPARPAIFGNDGRSQVHADAAPTLTPEADGGSSRFVDRAR